MGGSLRAKRPSEMPPSTRVARLVVLLVGVAASGSLRADEVRGAPPPLTRIAEIRSLPRADLAVNPAVRVRAVVTRSTPSSLFVQDETAGMYVNIARSLSRGVMPRDVPRPTVPLGSEVEIEGMADPGGYSPIILPRSITVLGPGTLPPPRRLDPATFFSGADDSQFVEVQGIVQDVVELETHWRLSLHALTRPFLASVAKSAVTGAPRDLIDAEVVVRGPTSSMSNTRGEFLMPWVFVERRDWLAVVTPAPRSDSDCPAVKLEDLARFSPERRDGHRIRTAGTVIHVVPGSDIFLQEGAAGIRVTSRDTADVREGDRIEVAGFRARDTHVAGLAHGTVLRLAHGPPLRPAEIGPEEISAINERAVVTSLTATPGDYCGCLVRFPARLIDRKTDLRLRLLVLSTGSSTVVARCAAEAARLDALPLGSQVEVTGIVALNWEFDPLDWPRRRPGSVSLMMRSADDVRVLQPPPFWTPQRLVTALGGSIAALVGVATWAWWLLRRRAELESLVAERTRELVVARDHERKVEEDARDTLAKKLRSSLSAAAVVHEINQPLARILLRCRLGQHAAGGRDDARPGEVELAALAADAEEVVATMDKMRVLLRNVQTTHAEIDLAQVVRSSLVHVQQFVAAHGVEVRTNLPLAGCRMLGDDVQLQVAIVNLLRNAVEAIVAADGVRREILVSVEDGAVAAAVEVGDSGPGWRGGTVDEMLLNSTKASGTGVGLFVVQTALENHGGMLEIGRSPLGGAVFRLTFPRAAGVVANGIRMDAARDASPGRSSGAGFPAGPTASPTAIRTHHA